MSFFLCEIELKPSSLADVMSECYTNTVEILKRRVSQPKKKLPLSLLFYFLFLSYHIYIKKNAGHKDAFAW